MLLLRKSHFQLLEILIGMFLLTLCIVPSLQIFSNIHKSQKRYSREIERDHLAHRIHAKIIESFYDPAILLNAIKEINGEITLPEVLKELNDKRFKANYKINYKKAQKGIETAGGKTATLTLALRDELISLYDDPQYVTALYEYQMFFELVGSLELPHTDKKSPEGEDEYDESEETVK